MVPPGMLLAPGAASADAKQTNGLAHLAPPKLSASMFWGFFVSGVRPTLALNTIAARILLPFCHAQGLPEPSKLTVGVPVVVLLVEVIVGLSVILARLSFTYMARNFSSRLRVVLYAFKPPVWVRPVASVHTPFSSISPPLITGLAPGAAS